MYRPRRETQPGQSALRSLSCVSLSSGESINVYHGESGEGKVWGPESCSLLALCHGLLGSHRTTGSQADETEMSTLFSRFVRVVAKKSW